MSHKGFQFPYRIRSQRQADYYRELDIVCTAYQTAGWMDVDYRPADSQLKEEIIFEWQRDGQPVYPIIDLSL